MNSSFSTELRQGRLWQHGAPLVTIHAPATSPCRELTCWFELWIPQRQEFPLCMATLHKLTQAFCVWDFAWGDIWCGLTARQQVYKILLRTVRVDGNLSGYVPNRNQYKNTNQYILLVATKPTGGECNF